MHNNMPKVLVIGGNGFLGSNIICELKNNGYNVSVLDIKAPFTQLTDVDYFVGSISNIQLLPEIMERHDYLIYLKSSTTPNSSMIDVNKAYMEDLPDLISVCRLCLECSIKKIVFASSGGTVYAQSNMERPYQEEDLTCPINHYGISKLAAENILLMYNKLFGMKNVVLRISNPYGIGQTSLSGVGAITTFAEKMITGQTIQVYGKGNIVRDYVEVSDVSRAFALALNETIYSDFSVFNIGSGKGFSIMQIIHLLQEYLRIEPKIEFLPERIFDISYNVLDITKAGKELGYFPIVMPDTGIKDYVQVLKNKIMDN